jgi:hypothetical protein
MTMTTPSLFDWIAEAVERGSSLTRLEARGAVRLTLQKLGHDAKDLTREQALALLEAALPGDLQERGLRDAAGLCARMRQELASPPAGVPSAAPAASGQAAGPPPSLFDWVAQALEAETSLGRLEARGTLRRALKDAGLVPERATRRQMEVVLGAVAPRHLDACAVAGAEAVCARVQAALRTAAVLEDASGAESPEEVFGRLGLR